MDKEFEFGPVARGIYIALISVAALMPLIAPQYFFYYVAFVIFLGFGLRPFLVKTGLYSVWNNIGHFVQSAWDKNYLEKRAEEIEKNAEIDKYRKSRVRDPKLPKNW